jgi:hypothetical protein
LSRNLSNYAGLFSSNPIGYFIQYGEYVSGIKSNLEPGQYSVLVKMDVDLPNNFLIYHSLGEERGLFLLAVPLLGLEKREWSYKESIPELFNKSINKIPWMLNMYKMGTVYDKKSCWMVLQKADSLVTNNFIAIGDTIAPIGHSSISISMLMGYDAAKLVDRVLKLNEKDNLNTLKRFNKYKKSTIFKGVEFEAKLILSLIHMSESELNLLGDCLKDINMEPFFIGSPVQQIIAGTKLMFKPKIIRNWSLIKQIFML